MKKEINAAYIAKMAGVSRSTVSRVINDYGNVTEETREKVLEVIKQYNYVPHASAQMLAGKKSRIIGLFIIDTKNEKDYHKVTRSSYFSPFTNVVIDEANKRNYKVLVCVINNNDDFKSAKELFYNKTISGGIFIGSKNNEVHIQNIIENGYKVAIIEQETNGVSAFNKSIIVNSDNYNGAYEATKYLYELGHRKIAHICGDLSHWTTISRIEGYKQAIKESGIDFNDQFIIQGNYTEDSGYVMMKKLWGKVKPTAVFVGNDSMSLGVYKAAKEFQINIPNNLSIVGFDDIQLARFLQPALTTIRVPILNMASIATNNLFQAIEDQIDFYTTYNIPVELIKRESCKKI